MKFRVSLSKEQVQWILSCPDCPQELKKQLRVHLLKIEEGLTQPAYIIKQVKPREKKDLNAEQQYQLACKFLADNHPIPEELQAGYDQYRYDNDLMSEEESELFEANSGF